MALQPKQIVQQRITFAPNITLALEVLRMPTLELRAFLEQQLEENPLLELEDSAEQTQEEQECLPELNGKEETKDNGLDEDWLSHWQVATEREDDDDRDADERRDQRVVSVQSLHESLRVQVGCQQLSVEERRLGELLIDHLDPYGYLEGSLEEVAAEAGVSADQLKAALKLIQQLDPPGVGARDLRECLMLQLEHLEAAQSLAYTILQDHFQLFVEQRARLIAKATGASDAQATEALAQLKRLNPKPGRGFTDNLPPCIVPDLIIQKRERHYDVELNDQEFPQIGMNRQYYRMLRDPRTPADAKEFLLAKFRNASWLIKAIQERNTTLLSISRCLISLQREFLDQGPQALKPLTQAQVASLVGRHPSTISRAIAGKTIDTPYGVFYLERLFASSVPQGENTESVSDQQIKSELQQFIAQEDTARPLSDATLAKRLAERHIVVARRTIAKYRTSLSILPAYLRHRRL